MNRKFLSAILLIILLISSFSGCAAKKDMLIGEYVFEATVLEINDNSVLVETTGEGNGISGVDKVTFNTENLPSLDIHVGSKIKVGFNGQVMYSYPAQINALSWQVCE